MPTSVVPAVISAIVDTAEAELPNLLVGDGWLVTADPGDYLMVGVEDPDVEGYAQSATSEQSWANSNYTSRDEKGDVMCAALSWNGDGDARAARDAVYATLAAVEDMLRANPSLGVDDLLWTSFGQSQRLNQIQDNGGAVALVLFSIHFEARI